MLLRPGTCPSRAGYSGIAVYLTGIIRVRSPMRLRSFRRSLLGHCSSPPSLAPEPPRMFGPLRTEPGEHSRNRVVGALLPPGLLSDVDWRRTRDLPGSN